MRVSLVKLVLMSTPMWVQPLFAANTGSLDDDSEARVCLTCLTAKTNALADKIAIPKVIPANKDVSLTQGPELRSVDKPQRARVTFYNPNMNTRMEGGPRNRFGEKINSIEDAIRNGRAVSVAADYQGVFGEKCNQRNNRCLMLIELKGLDIAYPGYRRKFPNLPKNTFVALVEDTGGDFVGTEGKRFDIAARSRALARAIPSYINPRVTFMRLRNPCGHAASGRTCDFAESQLSEKAQVAMGYSNPST